MGLQATTLGVLRTASVFNYLGEIVKKLHLVIVQRGPLLLPAVRTALRVMETELHTVEVVPSYQLYSP